MAAPSFAGLGKELVGHDVPEPKAGEGQSRIEKKQITIVHAHLCLYIYIYIHMIPSTTKCPRSPLGISPTVLGWGSRAILDL